ncbi:MAG: NAD(+) diphosphatase [Lachnospiraceae bacterium]|nr:NAD(+) diphosphatase [Lachnospiraceae bacterium]
MATERNENTMIQEIGKHRFHNEYQPCAQPKTESRVLFYRGREIFVKREEDSISFLSYEEVMRVCPYPDEEATFLFTIDGTDYFLFRKFGEEKIDLSRFRRTEPDEHQGHGSMESEDCSSSFEVSLWNADGLPELFPGYSWEKIELMRTTGSKEAAFAGVTGMQLYGWYKSRRFCPACGRRMVHSEKERMMHCEACGQMEYPKICPAVIVGVTCKDKILLTKYAGRTFKKYALIAGFAEIGETIEETVEREVMEEVGLKVKNIRYYKSQPWSFTDTLLMGFFAEVDGDSDIILDETELSEGKWCTRDEVPENDGVSLTREMMSVFKYQRIPF